jgi:hypothetical protein
MFQTYLCRLCLFGIGVLSCAVALGQAPIFGNPRPLSETGGNAAQELRSIYRRSIGTGYSVASLNQLSLNNARPQVPNVGQATARGSRLDMGLGGFGSNKPFSTFSPAPTVSPYLNLFREDLDGNSDLNYQTLVKPMLQQQEINQQLQRQNFAISQRLQQIAAQGNFNAQGSESQPPTGHQTVFGYYGHYYPALGQRRR